MIYLFDTNIVLHYLRKSSIMEQVEVQCNPFETSNESWLSIISFGEIHSLSLQNNWGKGRMEQMLMLLDKFNPIDIFYEDIILRYAEIDAYSQGKLQNRATSFTARNMGKNDLWIAACASILGATLLTTDTDFDHLNTEFLTLKKF
jgi:tRNA(fMet)-specific endonuclease VapC